MKRVVIIPNVRKDKDYSVTCAVIDKLLSLKIKVFLERTYYEDGCEYKSLDKITLYPFDEFPNKIDLVIAIGGDGSVIHASRFAINNDIPILGVNMGKVGYLAEVEVDNLDILDNLVKGDYQIDEKMLLTVDFIGHEKIKTKYAVNDVVIAHQNYSGVSDLKVEDSYGNVVNYRADGIILSTPQGSTAYSFSAGGPILAHDVESILLTPISPHSFFNRSVLFNSSDDIRVTNLGECGASIIIDGRYRGTLEKNEFCNISKAEALIKVLTFSQNSMFSNLFKKMRIIGGID